MSDTPEAQPVAPELEPDAIQASATGVVVNDDQQHRTGEAQAEENAENESPA